MVPADMESQFLDEYYEEAATVPPAPDGHYHIDIPFSIATQRSLLLEAGFKDFRYDRHDQSQMEHLAQGFPHYRVFLEASLDECSVPLSE